MMMMMNGTRRLGLGGLLIALASAGSPASAQQAVGGGASFVERFGSLDRGRWYISDGWANGPHQNCLWSGKNARVADGLLQLVLEEVEASAGAVGAPTEAESRPYRCAEIQTHEVYGHGTYEVRMRPAAARGLVSAFFTYIGPRPDAPNPHDEIDIEFLGKDARSVQLNYYASAQGGHEKIAQLAFDASETMADYAFEWLPDSIRWYINGELVHEERPQEGVPYPVTPAKIMLSIWGGVDQEAWLGNFEYPGSPLVARYERVAFTKAGDTCQFPESVVCRRK